MCGAINYPNSMGGPSICPSCDCGNHPKGPDIIYDYDPFREKFMLLLAPAEDDHTRQTQIQLLAKIIVESGLSREDVLQTLDLIQVGEVQES